MLPKRGGVTTQRTPAYQYDIKHLNTTGYIIQIIAHNEFMIYKQALTQAICIKRKVQASQESLYHQYLNIILLACRLYVFYVFVLHGLIKMNTQFLSGLCICPNTFAGIVHYGVFCRQTVIKKGTKYGPFKGKVVNTSEIKSFDDNSYMWEVSGQPSDSGCRYIGSAPSHFPLKFDFVL